MQMLSILTRNACRPHRSRVASASRRNTVALSNFTSSCTYYHPKFATAFNARTHFPPQTRLAARSSSSTCSPRFPSSLLSFLCISYSIGQHRLCYSVSILAHSIPAHFHQHYHGSLRHQLVGGFLHCWPGKGLRHCKRCQNGCGASTKVHIQYS